MGKAMFFGYYFGKLSIAMTDGDKPEKGDWNEIDVASLSEDQQLAYEEYKIAYKTTKALKDSFESMMRRSMGLKTVTTTKAKPAKKVMTLADFQALQQANGRNF